MEDEAYVWYASYGSNMNLERFLCYIRGGRPEGSEVEEVGCADPSYPLQERNHLLPFPLYFAKDSDRWQKKGVAFIGLDKKNGTSTYSRKYLITKGQFADVVKQENNGLDFPLDLDEVVSEGQYTFRPSWYGTVLYAGEEAGFPIFTFSADWGEEVPVNAPSYEYLNMIAKGLREYVGLQPEEIVNYLRGKPGITGYIQDEDLWSLARSE